MSISIQPQDFNVGEEYQALSTANSQAGAVVFFVGKVRDLNLQQSVNGLYIEHYPGMTEKTLATIVNEARARWDLISWRVIHRTGMLHIGDQIVFVGVTSKHREDAFHAAEFLMDYLKTQAPFWKKEFYGDQARWLEAQEKDQQSALAWNEKTQ